MQTRVAKCGHEYRVPNGTPGRRRNRCPACVGPARLKPTSVRCCVCDAVIEVDRRRGSVPKYCSPTCYPRRWGRRSGREPGCCKNCGQRLDRVGKKYCSLRCGEIHRGTRLAAPLPQRSCALDDCDVVFVPKSERQRCCCERHGKLHYNRTSRADGRQRPTPWNDRRRDNYHRRKARKKGASSGDPVRREQIAMRDRWRCQLCGTRVDRRLHWPDPRSASLDHIVPLSSGGRHEPANVQLAHLECNVRKSNRGGGEQLALIG